MLLLIVLAAVLLPVVVLFVLESTRNQRAASRAVAQTQKDDKHAVCAYYLTNEEGSDRLRVIKCSGGDSHLVAYCDQLARTRLSSAELRVETLFRWLDMHHIEQVGKKEVIYLFLKEEACRINSPTTFLSSTTMLAFNRSKSSGTISLSVNSRRSYGTGKALFSLGLGKRLYYPETRPCDFTSLGIVRDNAYQLFVCQKAQSTWFSPTDQVDFTPSETKVNEITRSHSAFLPWLKRGDFGRVEVENHYLRGRETVFC
jgi:hypothetical protein